MRKYGLVLFSYYLRYVCYLNCFLVLSRDAFCCVECYRFTWEYLLKVFIARESYPEIFCYNAHLPSPSPKKYRYGFNEGLRLIFSTVASSSLMVSTFSISILSLRSSLSSNVKCPKFIQFSLIFDLSILFFVLSRASANSLRMSEMSTNSGNHRTQKN